jgi:hypothetical protein
MLALAPAAAQAIELLPDRDRAGHKIHVGLPLAEGFTRMYPGGPQCEEEGVDALREGALRLA